MAEPVAPTGAMPMVPSFTPSASCRSPAELVAAEVLDLHFAAGTLADELHELALAFGVDAFGLDGAHPEAQGCCSRRWRLAAAARPAFPRPAARNRARVAIDETAWTCCILLELSVRSFVNASRQLPACVRCGSQSTSCGM
jgi:hypothetical protein